MTAVALQLANLHEGLRESMRSLRSDRQALIASRERVEQALKAGDPLYGVNTGFGALARTKIADSDLARLQHNLLISHAVGVGPPVPPDIALLMLRLKIHALGLGYSGISEAPFVRLLDFEERGLIPTVPSRGSVGASGDLAPLAHLALPLVGFGSFWSEDRSSQVPAAEVLKKIGWEPVALGAKDGLSLINGTQLMSAYGSYVLFEARRLVRMADATAAMSLEAMYGSVRPFDERIYRIRPFPGHGRVSANVRALMQDSKILEDHAGCDEVQDPYCLRCTPQVHGASRDALEYAAKMVEIEINSVTDNPLVFENGDVLSGGNFHGQPLAIALDCAAMALAELGSISERRTYLLLEGKRDLPRLLMKETGINSGFMIPQYTAAALVSENKVLCHPACVDSIPTCLGQEDHVSMGSVSALKLLDVFRNVEHVLAIEMLTAAQALDFREKSPGLGVGIVHRLVRAQVPHRDRDDFFQGELEKILGMLRGSEIEDGLAKAGITLE